MREKYVGSDQVHTASGSGMPISHIGQSNILTQNRDLILKEFLPKIVILFLRDFYNCATSCATLLSFVPSFTTCSVLPLYCTLVLSFAIPSTVIRFLPFMTRGPHRRVN
jgi:hypothetical protein